MKLKFVKLANSWYVQLPDYDGSVDDLEMVAGADSLCHELDTDNDGIVGVDVFNEENGNVRNADIVLDFMFSTTDETGEQDGAYYNVSDLTQSNQLRIQQIWLCNVVKYVFKKFPPVIYVKVINNF